MLKAQYPNLNATIPIASGLCLDASMFDAAKGAYFAPARDFVGRGLTDLINQQHRQLNRQMFGDGSGTYGSVERDPDRPDDLREALLRTQLNTAQGENKELNRALLNAVTENFALKEMLRILEAQVEHIGEVDAKTRRRLDRPRWH